VQGDLFPTAIPASTVEDVRRELRAILALLV
jgi:hypothetical protein